MQTKLGEATQPTNLCMVCVVGSTYRLTVFHEWSHGSCLFLIGFKMITAPELDTRYLERRVRMKEQGKRVGSGTVPSTEVFPFRVTLETPIFLRFARPTASKKK